jgi:hypothetical protein
LRARWLLVSLLTLAIYPNAYTLDHSLVHLPNHPLFMLAILGRNAALLALVTTYLWPATTGRIGEILTLLRVQPAVSCAPASPASAQEDQA